MGLASRFANPFPILERNRLDCVSLLLKNPSLVSHCSQNKKCKHYAGFDLIFSGPCLITYHPSVPSSLSCTAWSHGSFLWLPCPSLLLCPLGLHSHYFLRSKSCALAFHGELLLTLWLQLGYHSLWTATLTFLCGTAHGEVALPASLSTICTGLGAAGSLLTSGVWWAFPEYLGKEWRNNQNSAIDYIEKHALFLNLIWC